MGTVNHVRVRLETDLAEARHVLFRLEHDRGGAKHVMVGLESDVREAELVLVGLEHDVADAKHVIVRTGAGRSSVIRSASGPWGGGRVVGFMRRMRAAALS